MIWIFGDSFSAPFDNFEIGPWAKEYIKWKGYVPKTFGDNLADKLNTEVRNFALGGSDNDTIFESIIKNVPHFKKDDIIIVGWSSIVRFRLVNNSDRFVFILPNFNNGRFIKDVSETTMNEILVNRSNPSYFEEFKIRFDFLNWLLKDYTFIKWSSFYANMYSPKYHPHFVFESLKINNILQETNKIIDNTHHSETGHLDITEHFIRLINDKNLRSENNSISPKMNTLI
jgi:hypothetical protein